MADPVDLTDQIVEAAGKPASVSVDGTSVSAVPLRDLLEAQNRLDERAALARGVSGWGRALRPARVIPPGAIGPRNTEL